MKASNLAEMKGGWFIGNFEPLLRKTNDVEVSVKKYQKGAKEEAHFHKIATEYTAVISGKVRMFGREWSEGDIIIAEPGDATSFEALTDAVNVVVKLPGANNDKYLCKEDTK